VALAALSLLLPIGPTYDPWSWIVWGREIAHGTLATTDGPSWKPLPVLFTTPFSVFGQELAPELWLVVARAGALLGIAMAARLAWRVAGPAAGVAAALLVAGSEEYLFHAVRGNSEGLLVGLSLWAVERHLDGRRASAFALTTAAALLRPEVWPFFGLYGLWLAWREPSRRAVVAAAFAAVPVLWFVPEWLGSGDPMRAASRARVPNLDSPAYADFPALEVIRQSLAMVPLVVGAGAAAALASALRRRTGAHDYMVVAFGVSAAALLLAVAAMTEGGFSGNVRYVLLPIAFVCVLAAIGWVETVRVVHGRLGPVAAVGLAALGLAGLASSGAAEVPDLQSQWRAARAEASLDRDLPSIIDRAGGEARLRACGMAYTTRFHVPAVAWELHRHIDDVEIFPFAPGAAIAPRHSALSRDRRFTIVARSERWVAALGCR
jgi:hypothetical protein